ncbi:MAG: membrane protein insertase YidC [Halioglobus sp.]
MFFRNPLLMCTLLLSALLIAPTAKLQATPVSDVDSDFNISNDLVRDSYPFYGLARYLNASRFYIVGDDGIGELEPRGTLQAGQWLASVGRFQVLLLRAEGLQYSVNESELSLANPELLVLPGNVRQLTSKHELNSIDPILNQLRYAHLWTPLALLARLFEDLMELIHGALNISWGITLVLVATLVRLVLLPVTILTQRAQNRVTRITQQLAPVLAEIKSKYDGEEAHNHLMAAHKSLSVTPFYSLKPMFATLIQLPVLIAVFNALAEMPQLAGQSFLWISDLAYPDAIAELPLTLPFLGNTLNLLPWVMTAVSLLATAVQRNPHASAQMLARQRRNLYLMSAVFLLLFYPFPAAMVFYWTLATGLSALQQIVIKVK